MISSLQGVIEQMVERPGQFEADLDYAKYLEEYRLSQHGPQAHGPMSRADWEEDLQLMADPILGKLVRDLYRVKQEGASDVALG